MGAAKVARYAKRLLNAIVVWTIEVIGKVGIERNRGRPLVRRVVSAPRLSHFPRSPLLIPPSGTFFFPG